MSRSFIIEHATLGAYLGVGVHPRTRKLLPLFRFHDNHAPAKTFASPIQAIAEAEDRDLDGATLSIQPLNA